MTETMTEEYKAFVQRLADERDKHYMSLLEMQKETTDQRLLDQAAAVAAALAAAKEAFGKAESASDKRFDSVNEFRGQLKDQAATFITRDEYTVQLKALAEKIDVITANFTAQIGRTTEQINNSIASLALSRAANEGKSSGRVELWGIILSTLATLGVLLGIYWKLP